MNDKLTEAKDTLAYFDSEMSCGGAGDLGWMRSAYRAAKEYIRLLEYELSIGGQS